MGDAHDSLPGHVLENVIVLDVEGGTPGELYEAPCWFATFEGTLIVYKTKVRVLEGTPRKQLVAIRKLPIGMQRPYEDFLGECMLLGSWLT